MASVTEINPSGRPRLPVLVIVIAAYAGFALCLRPAGYLNTFAFYGSQLLTFSVILLVLLPVVGLVRRPRAPLAWMREVIVGRMGRLLIVAFLICVGLAGFTTLKLAIPEIVPFYADPVLADFNNWIHGGQAPGQMLRELLPSWTQLPLAYLYGPVWIVSWFGMLGIVTLQDDAGLRRRYFWCMAIAVGGLGTAVALAMSSVGPILYERVYHVDRFPDLMRTLSTTPVGDYMSEVSNYLFNSYTTGLEEPGAGISAMPSIHLAIVTLNALTLTRLRRVAGVVAWVYVALILVGSVYLGWHYAIDGYVSIAAVCGIWWLTARLQPSAAVRPDAVQHAQPQRRRVAIGKAAAARPAVVAAPMHTGERRTAHTA